jgi:hypothetical protein
VESAKTGELRQRVCGEERKKMGTGLGKHFIWALLYLRLLKAGAQHEAPWARTHLDGCIRYPAHVELGPERGVVVVGEEQRYGKGGG